MKAADFYTNNLSEIREKFTGVKNTGILYINAKKALEKEALYMDLVEIKECYMILIDLLEAIESGKPTMKEAYFSLKNMKFSHDPVKIQEYIYSRLAETDYDEIISMKKMNISAADYYYLQNFQPSSISVERSFSMLKKMLRTDRQFMEGNVGIYFLSFYNSRDSKFLLPDGDSSDI